VGFPAPKKHLDRMKPMHLPFALILSFAGAAAGQTCHAPESRQFADQGGQHVAECSALTPSHYPPTSGPHFPVWANPGTYHAIINAGYWLHSAEHGSVIFLINCQRVRDCDADFSRFQAIADAFPFDSACSAQDKHRIVISADTLITTGYAAVAWDWSLESDCFDSTAFAGFLKAHYAHATEDICGGGTNFPGTGWCNGLLALKAPRSSARKAARTWRAALWPGLPENVRPDGKSLKTQGSLRNP
jgi:hypothetical protein